MNLIPKLEMLGQKFAIALHDAGAANLLIEWLRQSPSSEFKPWISGPARSLWKKAYPHSYYFEKDNFLDGVDGLICGTGWASALEFEAMELALGMSLPVYAVIDHWVNYEQRFNRDGISIKPTEIWVSDAHAESKALLTFPKIKIQKYENIYLRSQVANIKNLNNPPPITLKKNILYIAEPIRQQWMGHEKKLPEFQALDYFLSKLPALMDLNDCEIRLRLHPSESIGKYDDWVKEKSTKSLKISIDRLESLDQSIAWSNMAVGCHSFGLIVALVAGRKVYCSIPPWGGEMFLPYKEIIKISEL